jgi:hypothetical protein
MTTTQETDDDGRINTEADETRRLTATLVRETVDGTHGDELMNFDAFLATRSEAADALRHVVETVAGDEVTAAGIEQVTL